MKNKMLFLIDSLHLGGVETVFIRMLDKLDLTKNEVTVYLIDDSGILTKKIPNGIIVKKLTNKQNRLIIGDKFKDTFKMNLYKGRLFSSMKLLYNRCFKGNTYLKLLYKFDNDTSLYDVVVNYNIHDLVLRKYMINNTQSIAKVSFLHNDINNYPISDKDIRKDLNKIDTVYAVSKYSKNIFDKFYLNNKTKIFYNYLDENEIKDKSKEEIYLKFNKENFNIVTIGRISYQKGFDIAINSMLELLKHNKNIHWYFIGDGPDREKIKSMITDNKLNNNITMLGEITNPFPYVVKADLYVQPSRFEGYCTTTNEAKVLKQLVLTTNVSGSDEQFINNFNGVITEINYEEIAKNILDLINNRDKINELKNNLLDEKSKNIYGNLDWEQKYNK